MISLQTISPRSTSLFWGFRNKVVGIKFIRKPTEGQFTLSSHVVTFAFRDHIEKTPRSAICLPQKTYNPMNMDITITIIIMNHPHPRLLNNQAVS